MTRASLATRAEVGNWPFGVSRGGDWPVRARIRRLADPESPISATRQLEWRGPTTRALNPRANLNPCCGPGVRLARHRRARGKRPLRVQRRNGVAPYSACTSEVPE